MKWVGPNSLCLFCHLSWRIVGLSVWLASMASVSAEQPEAALGVRVDVGIDGYMKVGCWSPVFVEYGTTSAPLSNPLPEVPGRGDRTQSVDDEVCELEAIDSDGIRVVYPLRRQERDDGSAVWSGVFRTGRLDADLDVTLRAHDGKVLAQRHLSTRPESRQSITIGRQSVQVWAEVGFDVPMLDETPHLHVARWHEWPKLIEIPWSLDGVDGVVLSSHIPLTDSVASELQRWLRRGGQMLLSVTTDRDEFEQTRWAELLRDVLEVRERTRTNDLTGVESFTVFGRRIPVAKLTPVTIFTAKEGRVLVSCLEGTLVTRVSLGFGQVTAIGLDLTAPPMSRWDGRSAFLRRLLFRGADSESTKSAEGSRLSQSGITDLASQWRAAVIEIPEVARPSLWGVLGLLLTYSLVIGPLDFLLVHRLLRRPHWTWATFFILVAAASASTLWWARAVNGDAARMTQLDVVDIDVNRQEIISRSWATTYSTMNQLCRVEAEPVRHETAPADSNTLARLSWLGFPENSPGGLYRPSGIDLGQIAYRASADQRGLDGIPLGQWSSKSLTSEARWTASQPIVECQLMSESANDLSGQIVHHFPFVLRDWLVAFEGRIFRPHPKAGEAATLWAPNRPWNPNSSDVYPREMKGFLTRTKVTKVLSKKKITSEDILIEQERYNPLDLDPADILQMMTLHEAAGGRAYTGLDHTSLRTMDLTPLLSLDRAVLIARVPEPQTEWRFNGTTRRPTRHHGFVRLLLPVKRPSTDSSGFRRLPKFENTQSIPTPASDENPNTTPVPSETKSP